MSVTLSESKGYYFGKVRLGGKSVNVSLGTDSVIVARWRINEVKQVQRELVDGGDIYFSWESGKDGARRKYPTVQESFKKFIDDRQKQGARELSIKSYLWKVSLFINSLGNDATIDMINQGAIDSWKISMIDNGTAAATINSYMKHLKVFIAWLNESYQMEIRIKSKPLRASDDFLYIPDDVFEKICREGKKISPLLDWAFRFYRDTGARLREIYNGVIHPMTIRVSGDKSKGHKTRVIPLAPGEAAKVQELRNSYSPENLSRIFHKCSLIAGKPYKFHSLRHTCAVLTYLESKDILAVKARLGHSSVTMSEKYTTFDYYQLREDFPTRFAGEKSPVRMAK